MRGMRAENEMARFGRGALFDARAMQSEGGINGQEDGEWQGRAPGARRMVVGAGRAATGDV